MAYRGMVSGGPARKGNGRSGAVSPLQVVILIAYAAVVAFLIVLPMYVDQVSEMLKPLSETTRFVIAVGSGLLIAFVLIAMIAVKASGPTDEMKADLPVRPVAQRIPLSPPSAAPVGIPASGIAQIRQPVVERTSPQSIVTYPDLVEGGIFGDTFIRISPLKTLKLRSMVVEPEHLN